ncbi:MAG: N-acetyltransferase [Clostridiales Family XIII bacterium]|jgi:predicted GNAT family acetyltransferase|nr:N-acetyltransferase [Clostridiales Family XIII bacterium]
MEFEREGNWLFKKDENGGIIAEITFPNLREGTVVINHTFVDDSLRGQGIAGKLVEAAYDAIKADGKKAVLTCPYAVKWFNDRPDKNDIVIEG